MNLTRGNWSTSVVALAMLWSGTTAAWAQVKLGIDILVEDGFRRVAGARVGLITNHTGVDATGRRTIDLLHDAANVELVRLFSPEHGLSGTFDEKVGHGRDEKTGLAVFSLYGETRKPTAEMLAGIDVLVFDIQDIGVRFYTYISTLGNAMEAAGAQGVRVVVLDRPNPIAPLGADGPFADADKLSFVAYAPIPVVHGLTVGELARLFNATLNMKCTLDVVQMGDWKRSMWWDATGLMWVNPSPNIRNPTQALLYPAIGLLEFTNLSVGRGTDQPFEQLGAPWIDGRALARALNESRLPGLRFTPITFTPTSSKFAGEVCEGVYVAVTDRSVVRPVRTGLAIAACLRRLFSEDFDPAEMNKLLVNDDVHDAWREQPSIAPDESSWGEDLRSWRKRIETIRLYPE